MCLHSLPVYHLRPGSQLEPRFPKRKEKINYKKYSALFSQVHPFSDQTLSPKPPRPHCCTLAVGSTVQHAHGRSSSPEVHGTSQASIFSIPSTLAANSFMHSLKELKPTTSPGV